MESNGIDGEENPFDIALKAMEARLNKSMKDMIEPLETSINSLVTAQKDWAVQRKDIDELKADKKKLSIMVRACEARNNQLENRVKVLENKLMENNIIMHGVKESSWELDSTRRELVTSAIASTVTIPDEDKKLEAARKIPIQSTQRIGKYSSLRSQPIRISFSSKADADLLLERKKMLKQGIYIDREYSYEDEQIRKKLRPILCAARKIPDYKKKCKMEGTTLVLKSKKYDLSNLDSLPDELNSFNITSKQDDRTFGFFGELNAFSNFHPVKFTLEGCEYHLSEQLIQYNKSKFFGDVETCDKILECKSALECKLQSKTIKNYDHEKWTQNAKRLCEEGIKAKFLQNAAIRDILLSTKDKTLVECCNDKLWGNGVSLYDDKCLDCSAWNSQGILGEILEMVRSYITDILGTNKDSNMIT